MKIVITADSFCEYSILQANSLAERGHSVLVVLPESLLKVTVGDYYQKIIKKGVNVLSCVENRAWKYKYYQIPIRVITKFDPDLIHIHENGEMLSLAILLKFHKIPIVLTVHDVKPHPGFDSKMKMRRKIIRELLRRRASAIHLHSNSLGKLFCQMYPFKNERVHIIPHGVLDLFTTWKRNDIEKEPYTCLFFGRMEKYRGLDNLLTIADKLKKMLPKCRIVIAGTGTEFSRYKKAFDSLGNCEIHDRFIPDSEVARFFQRACCILLPYHEASQSGVLAVALAFSRPVVATDVGAIKELIQDGVHGRIVPANNMKHFADATVNILTNEEVWNEMRDACLRLSNEISFQSLALYFEKMYNKITNLYRVKKKDNRCFNRNNQIRTFSRK